MLKAQGNKRGKSLHSSLHSPLRIKGVLVRALTLPASFPWCLVLISNLDCHFLCIRRVTNSLRTHLGPEIREAHTYLFKCTKVVGMKFSISASFCRILINLISKNFKMQTSGHHLLFLQVKLLQTMGLFISYSLCILIFLLLLWALKVVGEVLPWNNLRIPFWSAQHILSGRNSESFCPAKLEMGISWQRSSCKILENSLVRHTACHTVCFDFFWSWQMPGNAEACKNWKILEVRAPLEKNEIKHVLVVLCQL